MTEIILAGFGGQGVLTAGLILAQTGMQNGQHVTWIPSYGSEMRGGTANCQVKISPEAIASPFVKMADLVLALNQPSADKFAACLKPEGVLLVNSTLVKQLPEQAPGRIVSVPATDIADKLGNGRAVNLVLLGALAATSHVLPANILAQGVDNFFQAKGKNNPLNQQCFWAGYAAAGGQRENSEV
ncbi:MAG: 2-oxoacid:acceptor oxidoreductase family protein [Desulfurispora sp.]|uniref:2-oxoacid:acceptor oxidoreductase family protein n=1 Tax=Desulfurispora sp. TaxID=3014275 RepID=UPI00404AB24F